MDKKANGLLKRVKSLFSIKARQEEKRKQDFEYQLKKMRNFVLQDRESLKQKVIFLTSSLRGEGKTTIAVSFAKILAEGGHKTLIIDANFDNPSIGKIYNIDVNSSLLHCLAENKDISEIIHKTDNKFLDVLPSEKCDVPFLNRGNLKKSIDSLRNIYEVIIFDSSALLDNSESIIISLYADAVFLVVESLRTKWQTIEQAKKSLDIVGNSISGVIVNKKRYFIPSFIYKFL